MAHRRKTELNNRSTEERIIFNIVRTMKKICYSMVVMLIGLLSTISCATDDTFDESVQPIVDWGFYVDLDSSTRITFEDNRYAWEGDERLGVYVASSLPTPNTYADVQLKDGRGYCAVTTKHFEMGDKMYVYHPFSDVNDAYSCSNVHLFIPPRQNVEPNVLDVSLMPMVGEPLTLNASTIPTVYMRPLAGLLCFKVYASGNYAGEKVSSVRFEDEDTVMTGEFLLDATSVGGAEWGLSSGDVCFAVATLAKPYVTGKSNDAASTIYMVVAPNVYSGKLIVTTDKAVYTYNYAKTVERNTYYDINIDLSKAVSRKAVEGTFGGGNGSEGLPYLIDDANDLVALAAACKSGATLGKYYRQIADIDLSKVSFQPIGTESLPFEGVYDGGNFSVMGIVIAKGNKTPCGMFGYLQNATVRRVVIDGFTNNGAGAKVGGVAGCAVGSTIEECVMNSDLFASLEMSGGMVGWMSGGKVSGCTTTSTIKSISTDTTNNWAQSGGIVGYACNGAVVENCTLSGNVASMGKRVGGIVGELQNSTVKGCRVMSVAEVFNNAHSCGGVVGGHYGGTVSNCVVEGVIGSQGDYCGGISGYFASGEIRDCVVQGSASVITYNDYCGGIAGTAYTSSSCVIDGCASYADVRACHTVGGIVGYVRPNSATAKVVVTNSMHIGGDLFSSGMNSNSYNLVGGVSGWIHGSGEVVYANVCARPKVMRGLSYWISQTSAAAIGGVTGFRNGAKTVKMSGMYVDTSVGAILLSEMPIDTYSTLNYGAISGAMKGTATINSMYYTEGIQPIPSSQMSNVSGDGFTALKMAQMTDGTLLTKLNNYVSAHSTVEGNVLKQWEQGADGYPVISGLVKNTETVTAPPKRVSVIGDSISTYRGYISYNYGAHYPTTDGDLNLVGQTYWWRLIYDHMQNARFERNIAYSGTAVTRTTNPSSSSQSWFGQDYCTRFINQSGVGSADIVLIHGGTNDYAHNVDPLAPGITMRSTSAPSDASMQKLFDVADAATTRAQIEALNDTTFCEAYIKLICLVRERNPKVKIVCIIGDYLTSGIQQSIHKIAAHYGAKVVDLLAVNGYNDQTYMPKHDYNPSTGRGCHPSAKAMEFIADKIYKEHGAWLEE